MKKLVLVLPMSSTNILFFVCVWRRADSHGQLDTGYLFGCGNVLGKESRRKTTQMEEKNVCVCVCVHTYVPTGLDMLM